MCDPSTDRRYVICTLPSLIRCRLATSYTHSVLYVHIGARLNSPLQSTNHSLRGEIFIANRGWRWQEGGGHTSLINTVFLSLNHPAALAHLVASCVKRRRYLDLSANRTTEASKKKHSYCVHSETGKIHRSSNCIRDLPILKDSNSPAGVQLEWNINI